MTEVARVSSPSSGAPIPPADKGGGRGGGGNGGEHWGILRLYKKAGNSCQYFSNSYDLKDEIYQC